MNIQKKQIDELIPASYNPRKDLQPNDSEYVKLKRSLQDFGYVEPIIWNERTGNVVGGHQRLKILKELGEKEVECVVVNLDLEHEKLLNLSLNKVSGDWDYLKLQELFTEFSITELDITGFDDKEIQKITSMFIDDDNEENDDTDSKEVHHAEVYRTNNVAKEVPVVTEKELESPEVAEVSETREIPQTKNESDEPDYEEKPTAAQPVEKIQPSVAYPAPVIESEKKFELFLTFKSKERAESFLESEGFAQRFAFGKSNLLIRM